MTTYALAVTCVLRSEHFINFRLPVHQPDAQRDFIVQYILPYMKCRVDFVVAAGDTSFDYRDPQLRELASYMLSLVFRGCNIRGGCTRLTRARTSASGASRSCGAGDPMTHLLTS